MDIFWYIYFFLAGLVLGSFYNVVGLRLPQKESLVHPRSHCTACGHTLSPWELIPVVSYILLRGKCRSCGEQVSLIYPMFELASGVLFVWSFHVFGFSAETIVAVLFASLLIIISVSDLSYRLILDKVLLFFLLPLLLLRLTAAPLDPWWDAFAGGAGGFLLLLLVAVVSKGGMGGGDIKLYGVIGLVLGLSNMFLSLFLAAAIGLLAGVIGMIWKGWGRKTEVPFGPFIAIGALAAYFIGEDLIHFYLGILTGLINLF
ncbi:prepilin peptidase [Alkalicoccus daliensis]|uniref:Type 4 prepilin peptidase 1. Aspartic peptidase. MEROPS family A24A n=1 Tax=Alkalicoccus daliensis TaxID=745820 RepID=A0A1H0CM24_9BACI|nr:A24 family peptidase [Alkalicoccus daliensis]SDN58946.1 type 4 prepilin peptidase 1 . Aspartic peptidase. MEROPS family A24A [Alkalicoccus daliensis]